MPNGTDWKKGPIGIAIGRPYAPAKGSMPPIAAMLVGKALTATPLLPKTRLRCCCCCGGGGGRRCCCCCCCDGRCCCWLCCADCIPPPLAPIGLGGSGSEEKPGTLLTAIGTYGRWPEDEPPPLLPPLMYCDEWGRDGPLEPLRTGDLGRRFSTSAEG